MMQTAAILTWVLNEIQKLSPTFVYVVIFALVFGEAAIFLGFFLPGETAVLVGGAVASRGHVNIFVLCGIVVVAAIIGDSVGYFVGERYGHRILGFPVIRHRRVALERALENLQKQGPRYVFIGRFTAFLRAVMPGLAGMSKMHYRRFFVANAAGGLVWGIGFTLLGYLAGSALAKVEHYASVGGLILLALVVTFFVWRHFRSKKKEQAEEAAWLAEHPDFDTGDPNAS